MAEYLTNESNPAPNVTDIDAASSLGTVDPGQDPRIVLSRLYARMMKRRPIINTASDFYDGLHPLTFATSKFKSAFGNLFHAFADNWCGIVCDAVGERLTVNGFRVNKKPAADERAKRIWEENDLDLQSQMATADGLPQGAWYVTVWYGASDTEPEITVESAACAIVESHPKFRRRRTAGLRCWTDGDGYDHAELFLPDRVYLYRTRAKRSKDIVDYGRVQWVPETIPELVAKLDGNSSMPNPLGVVPMVEFRNNPRLYVTDRVGWQAHSEISSVVPLQNAVNKLLADMMIASEFAAYPQRHVVGYEPDELAQVVQPAEPGGPTKIQSVSQDPLFRSGPGELWWLSDPNARFGQFDAANLTSVVSAIDMVVAHIASISRTPQHYLRASADRLSGESIKSAETGLVAKVRRKATNFGASWEEVMRLAGRIAGASELAGAQSMETIWADPETRTESEHIDALGKKGQMLHVPDPQLWEEAGYTPEQQARFPAMAAQMALFDLAKGAARATNTGPIDPDNPLAPPAA